jgi:hypothetical protein
MKWRAALEGAGAVNIWTCLWVKPDGKPQYSGDRPGIGYESIVAWHAPGRSTWNDADLARLRAGVCFPQNLQLVLRAESTSSCCGRHLDILRCDGCCYRGHHGSLARPLH